MTALHWTELHLDLTPANVNESDCLLVKDVER